MKRYWLAITLGLLFLVLHLYKLTALPVFADEAIYVRWAQLAIEDFSRYALFPLNDGKTPLFIWLMIPFQLIFADQLWAARFVSVLIGLGQMGLLVWLVKLLRGKKIAQVLVAFLGMCLPFWYFHHRMALIDGTFTFFLTLSLCLEIWAFSFKSVKNQFWGSFLAGVAWGLAWLTKIPAILWAPAILLAGLWKLPSSKAGRVNRVFQLAMIGGVGLSMFLLLRLSPIF